VPATPHGLQPTRLSTAKYELTAAISDITIAGITGSFWQGYGGYIGSCCDLNGNNFDRTRCTHLPG